MTLNPREMAPDVLSTVARLCAVKCKVGENFTFNDLIYFSGMDDAHPIAYKASAADITTCQSSIWICQETISATGIPGGSYTVAHVRALITGIDTSAASAVGSPVYLSDIPGGYVLDDVNPTNLIRVGEVLIKDATNGAVLLMPQSVGGVASTGGDVAYLDWEWAPSLGDATPNRRGSFEDIYAESYDTPGIKRVFLNNTFIPSEVTPEPDPFIMLQENADLANYMFIVEGQESIGVAVQGTWVTCPKWIQGPTIWTGNGVIVDDFGAEVQNVYSMFLTDGAQLASTEGGRFFQLSAPPGDSGAGPVLDIKMYRDCYLNGVGESGDELISIAGPCTLSIHYGPGCGDSGVVIETDNDQDAIWNITLDSDANYESVVSSATYTGGSTVYLTPKNKKLTIRETSTVGDITIDSNDLLYGHIFINLGEDIEKVITLPDPNSAINFSNISLAFTAMGAVFDPNQTAKFVVDGGATISDEPYIAINHMESVEFVCYLGNWYVKSIYRP